MTRVWTPPHSTATVQAGERSVFLAGTIDNGNSVDWQREVMEQLRGKVDHIFNPRRPDWDASWEQREDNPQFNVQVTWELDHIRKATQVLMYFAPGSLSPITLLELGIAAAEAPEKMVVCCPEGFWRKGNVDILCTRYGVRRAQGLSEMVEAITAPLMAV